MSHVPGKPSAAERERAAVVEFVRCLGYDWCSHDLDAVADRIAAGEHHEAVPS